MVEDCSGHDTSSPPKSIPKASTLPTRVPILGLSLVGGSNASKLRRRRASRAAAGVFAATGVRFHDPLTCAGLGLILRNSAKLRLVEGVLRPKPWKGAPPPGVDIIDDGRGVDLDGGVDGARRRGLDEPGRAGDGDVAKYMSRLASSSPVCPLRAAPAAVKPFWRKRAERATAGGGVRGALGGDERIRCELFNWNDVMGRSSSSSSERMGEMGSCGTVDVSETKERVGACVVFPKRACLRWYMGDDSGNWYVFFHEADAEPRFLTLRRAWLLEAGY